MQYEKFHSYYLRNKENNNDLILRRAVYYNIIRPQRNVLHTSFLIIDKKLILEIKISIKNPKHTLEIQERSLEYDKLSY